MAIQDPKVAEIIRQKERQSAEESARLWRLQWGDRAAIRAEVNRPWNAEGK